MFFHLYIYIIFHLCYDAFMKKVCIINTIASYSDQLQDRIRKLENKLAGAPPGELKIVRNGSHAHYYIRSSRPERKLRYLPSSDLPKLRLYVNKKYIKTVLPVLKRNLKAANSFLSIHSGTEELDIADSMPAEMRQLNCDVYLTPQMQGEAWVNREYERNPFHNDGMIHDSIRGDKVRSKSEAMIANALYLHKLYYLVEPPLYTDDRMLYPDFAIMDPHTVQIVYWEHFGMMDNPEYAENACLKIREYASVGLYPGNGLICTFECERVPLSSSMIEKYIKEIFDC